MRKEIACGTDRERKMDNCCYAFVQYTVVVMLIRFCCLERMRGCEDVSLWGCGVGQVVPSRVVLGLIVACLAWLWVDCQEALLCGVASWVALLIGSHKRPNEKKKRENKSHRGLRGATSRCTRRHSTESRKHHDIFKNDFLKTGTIVRLSLGFATTHIKVFRVAGKQKMKIMTKTTTTTMMTGATTTNGLLLSLPPQVNQTHTRTHAHTHSHHCWPCSTHALLRYNSPIPSYFLNLLPSSSFFRPTPPCPPRKRSERETGEGTKRSHIQTGLLPLIPPSHSHPQSTFSTVHFISAAAAVPTLQHHSTHATTTLLRHAPSPRNGRSHPIHPSVHQWSYSNQSWGTESDQGQSRQRGPPCCKGWLPAQSAGTFGTEC